MTGMGSKGVHPRAVAVRSAANRLRWEVDLALGVWPQFPATSGGQLDAVAALDEVAETVAILHRILLTIEENVPEDMRRGIIDGRDIPARFAAMVAHHSRMHEVPR